MSICRSFRYLSPLPVDVIDYILTFVNAPNARDITTMKITQYNRTKNELNIYDWYKENTCQYLLDAHSYLWFNTTTGYFSYKYREYCDNYFHAVFKVVAAYERSYSYFHVVEKFDWIRLKTLTQSYAYEGWPAMLKRFEDHYIQYMEEIFESVAIQCSFGTYHGAVEQLRQYQKSIDWYKMPRNDGTLKPNVDYYIKMYERLLREEANDIETGLCQNGSKCVFMSSLN